MAFYWGGSTETVVSGRPGPTSWALVFWLSVLMEGISQAKLIRPGISNVAANFIRTVMYAVRIAVSYIVMLAIMSFEAGVLVAAVAGHATGSLLFDHWVFRSKSRVMNYHDPSDLAPLNC